MVRRSYHERLEVPRGPWDEFEINRRCTNEALVKIVGNILKTGTGKIRKGL